MQNAVLLKMLAAEERPAPIGEALAPRIAVRSASSLLRRATVMSHLKWLAQSARSIGPYMLVEMLLPGGTLIALLLWLSHHARLPVRAPWQTRERSVAAKVVPAAR